MTVPKELQEKAREIIKDVLDAKFKGKNGFPKIRMKTDVDEWGEEYLNVVVIYTGAYEDLKIRCYWMPLTKYSPNLSRWDFNGGHAFPTAQRRRRRPYGYGQG